MKEAGPSTPVEITGLSDVPQAGDRFVVFEDEKTARQIGETRAAKHCEANVSEKTRVTLDNLFDQMKQGEMKELNLIVKADVQGTVEAMAASLMKIEVEGVNVKIIHTGLGLLMNQIFHSQQHLMRLLLALTYVLMSMLNVQRKKKALIFVYTESFIK